MNDEDRITLRKQIVDQSYKFMSKRTVDGEAPMYNSDLWFVLPSVKKSLSLYSAIMEDVNGKRLLSATIISRTLIEVIVTLLFVTAMKKPEGFYEKFMEHGRIRIKRTGKGWEKVTITSQISWVEENYRITRLLDVYDNCSKLVHFSDKAVQLIIDRRKSFKKGEKSMSIIISDDEKHFDQNNFDEVLKTADGMMLVLKAYMTGLAHERSAKLKNTGLLEVE